MNWDAIGAVGEAIGALAVVITLVYLAVQVKLANAASRLAATATVHDNFNHASSAFAVGDNDVMIAHQAMISLEGLTHQQVFRFASQLYVLYCHFDMVYHLDLKGAVEKDELIRAMLLFRWMHSSPGAQEWWEGNLYDDRDIRTKDLFTVEFKEFVAEFEKTGKLPLPKRYSDLNG